MSSPDQIICAEFRILIQEVLDGLDVSDASRRGIRQHRDHCRRCCDFHDQLLQVTALAPEILAPGEFQPRDQAALWNTIVSSIEGLNSNEYSCGTHHLVPGSGLHVQPFAPVLIRQLGRLDSSKIDGLDSMSGQITDIGKFLLGPNELQLLHRLTTTQQPNFRVNRVTDKSFETLKQLQDYVSVQLNVAGTIVISPDGTVLSSYFRHDAGDCEALAIWAQAALHNAQAACKVLGYDKVDQLMSRSEKGYVIVANLHGISLVILIDGSEDDAVTIVNKVRSLS